MALLSILTGFIILIGAVRNSKFQRIRENVILRTLGAKGRQIRKIAMNEYLLLGILGSSIGVILALLATYILAESLFETPFTPSWIPFLVLIPVVCIVVVALGIANSRAVIKSPPLEVLRRDGV
jgi:putative ABC transport system permease protein